MKNALIIFVRNPEQGKVKTRLAATVGDETALSIYKKLLAHTLHIATAVEADKFIFYAEKIIEHDIWSKEHFCKFKQADGDLGNRMLHAFEIVFSKGYGQSMIIGSDCYELTSAIIEQGFEQLQRNDVVIGPANDGGYYLLGMKKLHPQIFTNKHWSTNTVCAETVHTICELQLSYNTLPVLNDVDEEKDVPLTWLNNA